MGLRTHDHTPTSVPIPDKEPGLEVTIPAPAVIDFKFYGLNEKGHGKPKGIQGLEMRWLIAETPPTRWAELTHSEFATRSPLHFTFENDQRGQLFYYAARWENTKGEKGPWTEITRVVIP
jgi:hypothetical protein